MGAGSSKQRGKFQINNDKYTPRPTNHVHQSGKVVVKDACPVTGKRTYQKLKNYADDSLIHTDTLHNKCLEPMTCSDGRCTGSVLTCLGLKLPAVREKQEVLTQARDFFQQYFSFYKKLDTAEHLNRIQEVENSITHTGTYFQTFEELSFGAKLAWRNSPRCIGRIQWTNLQLFDGRHIKTAKDMFDMICQHIIYATNGGQLRSAITVFPQRTDAKHDFRVWNAQIIRYAGYRQEDGSVIGDPASVEFTEICQGLGWKGHGGMFDVLPLVLQVNGEDPELFEYPPEIILEVPLKHPDYKWFGDMGLKWYAVPGVANMMFDCGGLEYTAAPFNGWYMGTEIGTRDLCDPQRYNIIEVVGKKMGLDTRQVTNLWKDRVVVELNLAVLHSYHAQGVTISDHHTASESFMQFMKNEQKARGGCPADWVWIVPPTSGSITPVFHQEMLNYKVKPAYEYMVEPWKTHIWKKKVPVSWLQRKHKKMTFKIACKAVLFAARLNAKALKKRKKCVILFATETGTAEKFAHITKKVFSYGFNVSVCCMDHYHTEDMQREDLVLIITSTFGNGDPPDNGKAFSKVIYTKRRLHRRGAINGVLSQVRYAVFGLGSRAYPKFCAFAHTLDEGLEELSAKRLYKCGEGDALVEQEDALREWLIGAFKEACRHFEAGDTYNINAATNSLRLVDKTWNSSRFRLAQAPIQTEPDIDNSLSVLHARPVHSARVVSISNLQSPDSGRETLLVKVNTQGDRELRYMPGDHFAIFPANESHVVEGVYSRLSYEYPNEDMIIVEMLKKGKTTSKMPAAWHYFSKIPPCKLRTALTHFFDLTTPPHLPFLKGLLLQDISADDKKKLENIINNKTAYENWKDEYWPNLLEVLQQFPSLKLDPTFLLTQLPLLQPRYYSISSSPAANPTEVHLTVAVVRYRTQKGKGPEHAGVCSSWLSALPEGAKIPCFVRSANTFHMPKEAGENVIMVGPGTGIAPFRSFWQQRGILNRSLKDAGKRGRWVLYFGCRRNDMDNIYKDELQQAKTSGALSDVYTALSREPNVPKTYVQHLMTQNGSDVFDMLVNKRSHFYICGDVDMAYDVTKAVSELLQKHGGMSAEDAEDYIQEMKEQNRMHEDIFGAAFKTKDQASTRM